MIVCGATALADPPGSLSRGLPRPTGPRGDAFVPGIAPVEIAPIQRRRPKFVLPPASPIRDSVDVIFFAKDRPVRVQIHVTVDDVAVDVVWRNHLKTLFIAFDRDRDGLLNRYEIEQIYSVAGMAGLVAGNAYRNLSQPPTLEEIDRDGDNRASFDEFAFYYREAIEDLVQPRSIAIDSAPNRKMTVQLFAALDLNADGKLSKSEVRDAEKILLSFDQNEDECLSPNELNLGGADRSTTNKPIPVPIDGSPTADIASDLQLFRTAIPATIVQQLLQRYDANKDAFLTQKEIGFDKETFDRFDANRDGKLSAAEWELWRTGPADFIANVNISDTAERRKMTIHYASGKALPAGLEIRKSSTGRLVLRVGRQLLDLYAGATPSYVQNRLADEINATYPADKTVVTENDIGGQPFQFLRIVFDAADFNGDGKLTRAEYAKYMQLQQSTIDLATIAGYATRTPSLFHLMDENGDGKLSVRELRTAWDRLIVLEPGSGTEVTHDAIQPSASIRFGRASSSIHADYASSMNNVAAPRKVAGPLWMQMMDRNGDGDISRLEFLGTRAEFDRIDTDKDGIVSTAEAEAYDKLKRARGN